MRFALLAVLVLAAPALASSPTCAPGTCVSLEPPVTLPIVLGDVDVASYQLDVDVVDGVATVEHVLELQNPGAVAAEVAINFPLPAAWSVLGVNLTVGGDVFEGRVLEQQEAQERFDDAKNESRDAILLSRSDRNLRMEAHAGPGEPRIVRMTAIGWVTELSGARILNIPTSLLGDPEQVGVDVRITDRYGMHDVSVPAAPLAVTMDTPQEWRAELHASGAVDDVVVAWREDSREWDVRVMAGDDAVLLRIDHTSMAGPLPRDVAFVLDTSGSMQGDKMVHAREALATALEMLSPGDRYTIHSFAEEVADITKGTHEAGDGIAAFQQHVRSIHADGSTNLHAGLLAGLGSLEPDASRVPAVVLFTDGLPTAGERSHTAILADALAASDGMPVHVVAIGIDADRTFLQDIATQTRGSFTYMEPDADLQERLVRLMAELNRPVVRDLELSFTGLAPTDVLPTPLPVLYEGRTITLLMRAELPAAWSVTLEGTTPAGPTSQTFDISADVESVPAVDALWGSAYVEALLARERAGEDLRDAITAAAIQYGVVTPYTSWLVVGPPIEMVSLVGDAATTRTSSQTFAAPAGGQGDSDSEGTSTPGFAPVALVAALLLALRRRAAPPL